MKQVPPQEKISADDAQAFADAMRDVSRLTPVNRAPTPRARLSARPAQLLADERAVMDELLEQDPEHWIESGEQLSFRIAGVQDNVFRRLKRGAYHVGAELDLHGMNSATAKLELHQFLADCRRRAIRCVRVIHGKGLRSDHRGPVLKSRVDGWLRRHGDVLAFASARPQDGGSGAVCVLLRAA